MELDGQGLILLTYLVGKLPQIAPGRPKGYVGYKQVHDDLGLALQRGTYGESLQVQGLNSLAEWTAELALPAITGLIIDRDPHKMRPGPGYAQFTGPKPASSFGVGRARWTTVKSLILLEPQSAEFRFLTPPVGNRNYLDYVRFCWTGNPELAGLACNSRRS